MSLANPKSVILRTTGGIDPRAFGLAVAVRAGTPVIRGLADRRRHSVACLHKHIARLQIAMHDAGLVRRVNGACHDLA